MVAVGSIVWGLGALVLGVALIQALGPSATTLPSGCLIPTRAPAPEGLMLYETLLMRDGDSLYGPITPDRFISGPYPPLYYLLAGWLLPPGTAGFTEGRTLSLWAALITAAALVLLLLGWGLGAGTGVGGWGLGLCNDVYGA